MINCNLIYSRIENMMWSKMNITRCVSSFFLRLLLLLIIIKKIILLLFIFPLEYFSLKLLILGLFLVFLAIVSLLNMLTHKHSLRHTHTHTRIKKKNVLNRIFWWTLYSNLIWKINKNIPTSSSSYFWIQLRILLGLPHPSSCSLSHLYLRWKQLQCGRAGRAGHWRILKKSQWHLKIAKCFRKHLTWNCWFLIVGRQDEG